jgi:hypothetical protein
VDERTCPSCGAQNAATAEYCWQCFARFGAPPAGTAAPAIPSRGSSLAAIGTGPGAGTPSAVITEPATMTKWQPQHSTTGERVAGWTVKGLVMVVAALVGFFAFQWLTRGLELPDEVAGQARMEGDLVEGFQDLMDSLTGVFDVEVDMAIYGPGFPVYLLMAAEVPDGQDVNGFYEGFVTGAGTSTGPADPDGVTCLAMPGGAGTGAQCSWVIDGTVLLLQGFTATEGDLAAVAEGVRADLS